MAPPKFVAPIRRNNGSDSSSCSFGSFSQDKVQAKPSETRVKELPSSFSVAVSKEDFSHPHSKPQKRIHEIVSSDTSQEKFASSSSDNSSKEIDGPSQKKPKVTSFSVPNPKKQQCEENVKENVNPSTVEKASKKFVGHSKKQSEEVPDSKKETASNVLGNQKKGVGPSEEKKKTKTPKPINVSNGREEEDGPSATNQKKKSKNAPVVSRPSISLSTSEWDLIFQRVIEGSPSKNSSQDLFDFSQSDLEDLEDEETGSKVVKKKNKASAKQSQTTSKSVLGESSQTTTNVIPHIDGVDSPIENSCSQLKPLAHNKSSSQGGVNDFISSTPTPNESKQNVCQPSPSIVYLCHPSQPVQAQDDNTSINQSETESYSQTFLSALSQEVNASSISSSAKDQERANSDLNVSSGNALVTSTPLSKRQPAKDSAAGRAASSQEVCASPIASASQGLRTPHETPIKLQTKGSKSTSELIQKSSCVSLNTSQNIAERAASSLETPSKTGDKTRKLSSQINSPHTSQNIAERAASSLKTPSKTGDKTQKLSSQMNSPHTSQNIAERAASSLETPSKTGDKTQKLSSQMNSPHTPGPTIPRGSQQLSQEIQSTPPPSGLTSKDRLVWLQKKRQAAGVWVQCDAMDCQKWRHLPNCKDPTMLPKKWFCKMHPDAEQNHCDAPTKRLSLREEEDMIYSKFSPGSLVWARLTGFPFWPAMVEDDPDLEQFYWLDLFSDIPTWYHVVFFDEKDLVTRAWVQVENLKPFTEMSAEKKEDRRVNRAYRKACEAFNLDVPERLEKFSFATTYKGPIGGHCASKRKFHGPLGHREPLQK